MPENTNVTVDQAWEATRETRAKRRREERREKKLARATSIRVCWRCGFGALRGIAMSNLVRMKDNEGNEAWGHAQPTVCAGAVKAITAQARMSVRESFADFYNITRQTIKEKFRRSKLMHFLKSEGSS